MRLKIAPTRLKIAPTILKVEPRSAEDLREVSAEIIENFDS